MDRELSLLMLTLLVVAGWLALRSLRVFPPTAAFVVFAGWWTGFFILGNVT